MNAKVLLGEFATYDLETMKAIMSKAGYRFETSDDGKVERMYRPDGSLALTATKPEKSPTLNRWQLDESLMPDDFGMDDYRKDKALRDISGDVSGTFTVRKKPA